VSSAEANKLREIWRIALLAICDLQRLTLDEGNRKAVEALRAILDLTEE